MACECGRLHHPFLPSLSEFFPILKALVLGLSMSIYVTKVSILLIGRLFVGSAGLAIISYLIGKNTIQLSLRNKRRLLLTSPVLTTDSRPLLYQHDHHHSNNKYYQSWLGPPGKHEWLCSECTLWPIPVQWAFLPNYTSRWFHRTFRSFFKQPVTVYGKYDAPWY